MTTYGYARSAAGSTGPQEARLRAEGCAEVYADHGPSAPPEGSGWVSLLGVLAPGDTVRVVTADRLGRRAGAFLHAGEQIRERGAQLVVEGRAVDTSTPQGRFLVRTLATFSEYEQALADEYGADPDTDGEAGVMSGQDSTPRAVVYHRVARDTPETADGQLEAVRKAAEAHGYEVVAEWPAGPPCGDCGVLPGTPHQDGCDVARCLWTGMQRLSCDRDDHTDDDCGWEIWTGTWPGEADCIRLGWYSKFTDRGWVQCGPDDPEAGPNLNRLSVDARWDRETHRWEPKS